MTEEEITDAHLIAAYRSCFSAPGCDLVLRDLNEFCRGAATTVVPGDLYATLVNTGRRETLLRICKYLNLTADEMMALRAGRRTPKPEEDHG